MRCLESTYFLERIEFPGIDTIALKGRPYIIVPTRILFSLFTGSFTHASLLLHWCALTMTVIASAHQYHATVGLTRNSRESHHILTTDLFRLIHC